MFSWLWSQDELTKALEDVTANNDYKPDTAAIKSATKMAFQNPESLTRTLAFIFARFDDDGKYWRRIYKALLLLETMINSSQFESSHMSDLLTETNRVQIKTLLNFQHSGTFDKKDIGMSIRGKAKAILLFLKEYEGDEGEVLSVGQQGNEEEEEEEKETQPKPPVSKEQDLYLSQAFSATKDDPF